MLWTSLRFESLASEFCWAWSGIRARSWRAALIVGMLGVALGASTVVFSAADSFVLGRVPYPGVDRLMLRRTTSFSGTSDYVLRPELAEWRKHSDLFSAVHAALRSE